MVLLFFGGKKIPELMKGIGTRVRSFKEGMNEMKQGIETKPEKGVTDDGDGEKVTTSSPAAFSTGSQRGTEAYPNFSLSGLSTRGRLCDARLRARPVIF